MTGPANNGPADPQRRRLLVAGLGLGGALLVGWRLPQASAATPPELLGDDLTTLTDFVLIERDNHVVIGARGCETGQGVVTALPMLIADQLDIGWSQVRVIQLDYGYVPGAAGADDRYGEQRTIGSHSIAQGWNDLRQAGALARWLLVQAAADEWRLDAATLRTEAGNVIAPDGRTLSYGALARSAASIDLPDPLPTPRAPVEGGLIGRPTRTVDARAVVTGRARYGVDAYLAGALVAVVLRCPHLDGTLVSFDDEETRRVPGVRDVIALPGPNANAPRRGPLAAGVAVLADNSWAALRGRERLKATWKPGPWANESNASLRERADRLLDEQRDSVTVRRDGDFAGARARARRTVQARYEMPFLAHATAEPPSALIELRADGALLIAALEDPGDASRLINELTGIARENIQIRLTRAGGGFGRRLGNDFVAEAVLIAKSAGKAVKLMWTREDDLAHDVYRPFGVHELAAPLDRRDRIAGWAHRCAATPLNARNASPASEPMWAGCMEPDGFPAGLLANLEKTFFSISSGMPRGHWRGGAHAFGAFAEQSFLDEIAEATRRDPLDLRLELLGEPRTIPYRGRGGPDFDTGRMANVLRLCAERIGWKQRSRSMAENGSGIGLACHFTFGGYAAHAFEVAPRGRALKILRAVCVADVGRVVNPLGLRAQLVGATIDGLSTALNLAITVKDGQVQQRGAADYPLLRMTHAPLEVDMQAVESDADPVGASEVGLPSVAPALANALFAATRRRIRTLPLLPEWARGA